MDRRLFLTGLLGIAGTAALATTLPAGAATGDPLEDLRPPRPEDMPEWEVAEEPVEEGEQYAVSREAETGPSGDAAITGVGVAEDIGAAMAAGDIGIGIIDGTGTGETTRFSRVAVVWS